MNSAKNAEKTIDGEIKETVAYKQYRQYYDTFLTAHGVLDALRERRRFFRGDHYSKNYSNNAPKPTLNLCSEGVVKIAAKITGTKRHISFIADKEDEDLDNLDRFYEHQSMKMDRDRLIANSTEAALIDGTSVVFTSFDADTIGTEGIYKGYLKDYMPPFEETFWSDPWTDDPQDMRYCGYFIDMEVGAARELIEGSEEEKEEKAKYVCPEGFFQNSALGDSTKVTDSELTRVYFRFFREKGEVYFEVATQYVTLTKHPHALNPEVTEERIQKAVNELRKKEEVDGGIDATKNVPDYKTDEAKYTLFTDAVNETAEGHKKAKRKFSRYPVAVNIPYQEIPRPCILGRSLVAAIIPNQKICNYLYLLITLIIQYHAMPIWMAKPNALGSQTIDNSPNKILIDYSSIQEVGGNGFGITRLTSGEAINSNLIQIADTIAANTRFILGFANLEATGTNIDSGYEYAQRMKQINLPLEIPQLRVWKFCGDLARNDLMYYMHYIDHAKFYTAKSDAEVALNENYRRMAQGMIDSGRSKLPVGTNLPKSRRFEVKEIDKSFFDADFDVTVEVEQGIAGSELTESQHYNQIWQYVAQGNLTADKIRMLVNGDPAISRKTRSKFSASIEELETSQLAMKDQQIQALQQAVSELQNYMKFSQQTMKAMQAKQKATEQAAADQNRMAAQLIKGIGQQNANPAGKPMSESEVKSMNAKGISGGSFAGGGDETIYNTGA